MRNIKNKIYVISYISLISLALIYTNKYSVILPPIILVALIIYFYKNEINNYDYKDLLTNIQLSNWIFYSIPIILITQTVINILMSKIINSELHTLSETVDFIPTSIIYKVIAAPIIEELFFRRILFKWLNIKLSFWIAASLSSIIFAIGHGSLVGLLGYIVVGMILCFVYKKTKNLGTVIIIHAFLNFLVILQMSLHMNINL